MNEMSHISVRKCMYMRLCACVEVLCRGRDREPRGDWELMKSIKERWHQTHSDILKCYNATNNHHISPQGL